MLQRPKIFKADSRYVYMVLASIFLLLIFLSTTVSAKNTASDLVPLRPADTSSPRDTLRSFITEQLRYETNSEQLRFILIKLREQLLGHPMVIPEPVRVRYLGYAAYSKNIEIFCYLKCREQNEFLAIQEDLLLRI